MKRRHCSSNRCGVPCCVVEALEPLQREMGALGADLDQLLPGGHRARAVSPACSRTSPRFRYAGVVAESSAIADSK